MARPGRPAQPAVAGQRQVPRFVETESTSFLDLPAFRRARLWLATRTDWRPNVLRFSANLVENLKPRKSQDLEWGVPVPLDGWSDNPMKKIYVWFDAVIGYLSHVGGWPPRARPGRLGGGPTRPPRRTTSWARTTSPSTR
ncbi:class I tRNA ligase family protein [Pseudonocardia sp. MCCB 268]|nr:class I tRNA ligase family protein [Pseudonocardia cytotoxica]